MGVKHDGLILHSFVGAPPPLLPPLPLPLSLPLPVSFPLSLSPLPYAGWCISQSPEPVQSGGRQRRGILNLSHHGGTSPAGPLLPAPFNPGFTRTRTIDHCTGWGGGIYTPYTNTQRHEAAEPFPISSGFPSDSCSAFPSRLPGFAQSNMYTNYTHSGYSYAPSPCARRRGVGWSLSFHYDGVWDRMGFIEYFGNRKLFKRAGGRNRAGFIGGVNRGTV